MMKYLNFGGCVKSVFEDMVYFNSSMLYDLSIPIYNHTVLGDDAAFCVDGAVSLLPLGATLLGKSSCMLPAGK